MLTCWICILSYQIPIAFPGIRCLACMCRVPCPTAAAISSYNYFRRVRRSLLPESMIGIFEPPALSFQSAAATVTRWWTHLPIHGNEKRGEQCLKNVSYVVHERWKNATTWKVHQPQLVCFNNNILSLYFFFLFFKCSSCPWISLNKLWPRGRYERIDDSSKVFRWKSLGIPQPRS